MRYLRSHVRDYTALLIHETTKDVTEDVNDALEALGSLNSPSVWASPQTRICLLRQAFGGNSKTPRIEWRRIVVESRKGLENWMDQNSL